jgi:sugar phosphate permease
MSLSSSTLAPQWFIAKKGQALSLVSLGGVVSSAILPPLNTWIIQNFGWQVGWRFWAVLLCLVMSPIAYFLIRDRPEDVGLYPDDIQTVGTAENAATDPFEEVIWTVREAMSTRCFWFLLFCRVVPSAIVTGLIFHQVSIMAQVGLPVDAAAIVLSAMAVVRFPVTLVAGQIADRVSPRLMIAFSQFGLFISMILLLLAKSMTGALIYGVFEGVIMSLHGIADSVIWPEYFGRRNLSSISGITMMAGVIGSALGPLPYGFAYDVFGNYTLAITVSMVFPLLGLGAALLAKRPTKT